jgi:hypothetical protein
VGVGRIGDGDRVGGHGSRRCGRPCRRPWEEEVGVGRVGDGGSCRRAWKERSCGRVGDGSYYRGHGETAPTIAMARGCYGRQFYIRYMTWSLDSLLVQLASSS